MREKKKKKGGIFKKRTSSSLSHHEKGASGKDRSQKPKPAEKSPCRESIRNEKEGREKTVVG